MERKEIIRSNENLKECIEELKAMGYKYVVKACDKWLSGWGGAENRKHIQIIACYDVEELNAVKRDVQNDNSFNYIDWNYINNYSSIYNWTRGKSYTIRNYWTRAFNK